MELFTSESILTMVHGIVLGGGALMALFASLVALQLLPSSGEQAILPDRSARLLQWLLVATAVMLWLTVLGGTYLVFPPYRATPPEGIADLSQYPRSLITSNPQTAWLHSGLLVNKELKRMVTVMLTISLLLVAFIAVLGVFINKVAPLD